jgi:hypothetical protein
MFKDGIINGFLWSRSVELLFLNIIFFIDKKKNILRRYSE